MESFLKIGKKGMAGVSQSVNAEYVQFTKYKTNNNKNDYPNAFAIGIRPDGYGA